MYTCMKYIMFVYVSQTVEINFVRMLLAMAFRIFVVLAGPIHVFALLSLRAGFLVWLY